jgi:choline dehydrogenase-like flavoprotein
MYVDTRQEGSPPETLTADVCIVGGGAAGISLARRLGGAGLNVILLEAGGLEPTPDGPVTYEAVPGTHVKLGQAPSMPWYLGGNTNHWFGNCRPLEAQDFDVRDWIPNSGWPLGLEELRPFYERAQAMSGLGDFRWYDPEACRPYLVHPPAKVDPAIVKTCVLQACLVLSFAELHGPYLEESRAVQIRLRTRALRLKTSADGTSVEAVETIDGCGRRSHVQAGMFVLACGGIENARLLLCSNERSRNGLGNDNDLVGRFFMEHWYFDLGLGEWNRGDLALYRSRPSRDGQVDHLQKVGDAHVWAHFVLSEALMQRERVAGLSLWFGPSDAAVPSVAATGRIVRSLLRGSRPAQFASDARLVLTDPAEILRHLRRILGGGERPPLARMTLRIQLEQTPSATNRIRLSAARDGVGEPRAELDLRLGDDERQGHLRSLRIAAGAIGLNGERIARQIALMLDAGRLGFFFHHIGATRMSERPTYGVVDRDCRVHGISNLYVAGSSVFPTAGTAAPTLTIVALALRVADHICSRLQAAHGRPHESPGSTPGLASRTAS